MFNGGFIAEGRYGLTWVVLRNKLNAEKIQYYCFVDYFLN